MDACNREREPSTTPLSLLAMLKANASKLVRKIVSFWIPNLNSTYQPNTRPQMIAMVTRNPPLIMLQRKLQLLEQTSKTLRLKMRRIKKDIISARA